MKGGRITTNTVYYLSWLERWLSKIADAGSDPADDENRGVARGEDWVDKSLPEIKTKHLLF